MVTNREGTVLSYRVRPTLDGRPLAPVEVGQLADEAEWDQGYIARAPSSTRRHGLGFYLERLDALGVYRHLSLKFEVGPTASRSPSPSSLAAISPWPGSSTSSLAPA